MCKATAFLCNFYHCCSLSFLLATANWLEKNNSYTGQLLTAPDRSKKLKGKLSTFGQNLSIPYILNGTNQTIDLSPGPTFSAVGPNFALQSYESK